MLSAINTSIDAIHGIKTQFVKTYVLNEEIQNSLQTYVDAQQFFAKDVAKATYSFFTSLSSLVTGFDAKKAFAVK